MQSNDSKRQDLIDSVKFYTTATFVVVIGSALFATVLLSLIN